jgi:hypothetical protein
MDHPPLETLIIHVDHERRRTTLIIQSDDLTRTLARLLREPPASNLRVRIAPVTTP